MPARRHAFAIWLMLCFGVGILPAQRILIRGASPDLVAGTLLISVSILGPAPFAGQVQLFDPAQGLGGGPRVRKKLASWGLGPGWNTRSRLAGVVFDGFAVWTANGGEATVSRIQASDGADLGVFPVGSEPLGLAFDGSSLWVSNRDGDSVSRR